MRCSRPSSHVSESNVFQIKIKVCMKKLKQKTSLALRFDVFDTSRHFHFISSLLCGFSRSIRKRNTLYIIVQANKWGNQSINFFVCLFVQIFNSTFFLKFQYWISSSWILNGAPSLLNELLRVRQNACENWKQQRREWRESTMMTRDWPVGMMKFSTCVWAVMMTTFLVSFLFLPQTYWPTLSTVVNSNSICTGVHSRR